MTTSTVFSPSGMESEQRMKQIKDEILSLFRDGAVAEYYGSVFDDLSDLDRVSLVAQSKADIRTKQALLERMKDGLWATTRAALEGYDFAGREGSLRILTLLPDSLLNAKERSLKRKAVWFGTDEAVAATYQAIDYAVAEMGPTDGASFLAYAIEACFGSDGDEGFSVRRHMEPFRSLDDAIEWYLAGQGPATPADARETVRDWLRVEKWRDDAPGYLHGPGQRLITYFVSPDGTVVDFKSEWPHPSVGDGVLPEDVCAWPYRVGDIVEVDNSPFAPNERFVICDPGASGSLSDIGGAAALEHYGYYTEQLRPDAVAIELVQPSRRYASCYDSVPGLLDTPSFYSPVLFSRKVGHVDLPASGGGPEG